MNYYEDTVPGRSTFKRLISTMESYAGLQGEEDVKFYGDITQLKNAKTTTAPAEDSELVSSETLISSVTEKSTTTTVTTEPEADPVEIGDGIVLVDKRAISVYGGSFTRGEAYAATLNAYHKELGSAVNVYSLVAPTAVSFYLPSSYASYTASEWDNIQHINENLDGVIPVDAYSALEKHTDENIYARTDHHSPPIREPPSPAILAACTRSPRALFCGTIRRTSPIIRRRISSQLNIMIRTSPTRRTAT